MRADGTAYTTARGRRYEEYIASKAWAARRRKYWNEYGRSCKVKDCGATVDLEVHHHTYERLGHELLTDLVGLCRVHHEEVHARHDASGRKRSLTRVTEEVTGLRLGRPAKPKGERRRESKLSQDPSDPRHTIRCGCKLCKPKRARKQKARKPVVRQQAPNKYEVLLGREGPFKKDIGACACGHAIRRGDQVRIIRSLDRGPGRAITGRLALQLIDCPTC